MVSSGLMFGYGLHLILFIIIALLAIAVPLIIGILIYRDARNQGMDPPILWALVAALVPSFIGVIIYFVVRSTRNR